MNKKEKKVEFNFPLRWEWGISIEEVRENLDAVEKLGATHIEIEKEEDFGSTSIYVKAYTIQLETDEEYAARMKMLNDMAEAKRLAELAQLEELKKKYPNA